MLMVMNILLTLLVLSDFTVFRMFYNSIILCLLKEDGLLFFFKLGSSEDFTFLPCCYINQIKLKAKLILVCGVLFREHSG